MGELEIEYCRRRAAEEQALARAATCPEAAAVHLAIAERYLSMADGKAPVLERRSPASAGRLDSIA